MNLRSPRIKLVRNDAGYWKWELRSADGRTVVCESNARYARRNKAADAAKAFPNIAASAVLALEEGGGV